MLAELANQRGVSGDEGAVRQFIIDKLSNFRGDITVDTMGNLLVRKGHVKDGPGIMLSAHMDEVGLMIISIQKNGLLKFKAVGSIDTRMLAAKRVCIGSRGLPAVIGVKPIHLQKTGEQEKPFDEESLYLDAGFDSSDEAVKQVSVGDYVTFDSGFTALGEGYCRGKAFDDRAGCLVLLELLLEDNGLNFDAAFTVQEEVGTRGAITAAYTLKPQVALVVETTAASDTPETEKDAVSTALGAGPAISFMDRTIIVSKKMREQLVNAAEKAGVAYQYRKFSGAGTDAGSISLSREGVQTAVVSIPCRYIHSPCSILQEKDIKDTILLVRTWLENRQ